MVKNLWVASVCLTMAAAAMAVCIKPSTIPGSPEDNWCPVDGLAWCEKGWTTATANDPLAQQCGNSREKLCFTGETCTAGPCNQAPGPGYRNTWVTNPNDAGQCCWCMFNEQTGSGTNIVDWFTCEACDVGVGGET